MATLPPEQVTQRTAVALVAFTPSVLRNRDETTTDEIIWATTTDGNDVTVTETVGSDQLDRAEVDERLDADPFA